MLILADNDVEGVLRRLMDVIRAGEWAEYLDVLQPRFLRLEDVGLNNESPDRLIWRTCQSMNLVLVTGNRAGGGRSLETAMRELWTPEDPPIITLTHSRRIMMDSAYASHCSNKLLEYLDRIESLRGTGRHFIP